MPYPYIERTDNTDRFRKLAKDSYAYKEDKDCTVMAVAVACDVPYSKAHKAMSEAGRKPRRGAKRDVTQKAIESLGFKIRKWSPSEFKTTIADYAPPHNTRLNITTHHPRRFPEVWKEKHRNMLFFTRNHVAAVRDHVTHDWSINNKLHVKEIWEVDPV